MPRIYKIIIIMGLIFNLNQASCQGQQGHTDRKPAAAGKFYPANPDELAATLKMLFSRAKPCSSKDVAAIVCPHAGYVFSGIVAASGFNQVDPDQQYDNVFIIASSHHVSFQGASIYNQGDYLTPLGKVKVNTELADKLIRENRVFVYDPEADKNEHSAEVQVPFLQYHLKKDFRLVPIVIGTQSAHYCKLIAEGLKPYFNGHNLFVFSTDFSHYPSWADARVADQQTCHAIMTGNADSLLKFLEIYAKKNVPNLATNLCGWTSILTMLYLTGGDPGFVISPVQYMNSGDTEYGDKQQVVGYWSLAVTRQTGKPAGMVSGDKEGQAKSPGDISFGFTGQEKVTLLKIARNTIEKYIREKRVPETETTGITENLKMRAGAFVTLREKGELRGCIGRFSSDMPLYKLIGQMAIASSTEDTRFEPVSPAEIDNLEIEISVLSPLRKIQSPSEIVLGKHGIYIKKGYYSGTFLPQVATETGWSLEDFLGHCSRDKAGLGWDGWKDAELFVYEACVFSEKEVNARKD